MKKPLNNKKGNMGGLAIAGIVLMVVFLGAIAWKMYDPTMTLSVNDAVAVPQNLNTQCAQNPAYTYSAIDAFASGTTVVGSDQIKNANDAPVATLANPKGGAGLQYWKNNASWYCEVISDNAQCGSNTLQTKCYRNSSVTLSVYDLDGRVTLSAGGGANNLSMSTNAVKNLELSYQATAKQAAMPFGGCMAVEANVNITEVIVNGQGITAGCAYPWTYTVGATTNTYKLFTIPAGFDKDGAGDLKRPTIQLKTGGSDPTTSTATLTLQPANYYVGNDGKFYLGIEKDKNSDTTKTAVGYTTTFIVA